MKKKFDNTHPHRQTDTYTISSAACKPAAELKIVGKLNNSLFIKLNHIKYDLAE